MLARLGSARAPRADTWTPIELFNTYDGLYFDPRDLSSMFQDPDGLVPVTASGQTVRKMLDKSGRNHHYINGDVANAVVYIEAGADRLLSFEGTNRFMSIQGYAPSMLNNTLSVKYKRGSSSSGIFLANGATTSPWVGYFNQGASSQIVEGGSSISLTIDGESTTTNAVDFYNALSTSIYKSILLSYTRVSSFSTEMRVGGYTGLPLKGYVKSIVFRHEASLSSEEIASLSAFMSNV